MNQFENVNKYDHDAALSHFQSTPNPKAVIDELRIAVDKINDEIRRKVGPFFCSWDAACL